MHYNKGYINWACRRGMLELDLILLPFFKYKYDALIEEDKKLFFSLLQKEDIILFKWIINYVEPDNINYKHIIQLIQQFNQKYNDK
ncbi:succinate dehydrogenase assembly factor 2 [Pantoea sp. Aalb]|uniref:FAD assembly factor SdhE n=1 Tax=Pantoea sp. Aalb TaxID=2576762 RepID=UPI001950BA6D|nr:succinate dehydrogenase assembly factor 2 [Pantoea sp. Aalb]